MFNTVLIANRGEIACRIIETLRRLGIRSVAVYSDADAGARHVALADVAKRIGPAPAAQSYLDIEKVIAAALETGAQAIHPGYGFLAENAEFARACERAGIVFIGPTPEAIDVMGDKISAKTAVSARNVPTVPGIAKPGLSDDDLIALGAQEMEVDFTFMIDGNDYRVIRKRSKARKTGQSWLDFQVRNNGAWKPLSGATIRETQQTIITTLRMNYDIFANSAYLRQGHADEFTKKEPGRRKQVLAEILGLDAYEKLEGSAKERARGLDGQLKGIEGQIGELQRQAEKQATYAQLVSAQERQVEQIGAAVAAAEETYTAASARVRR